MINFEELKNKLRTDYAYYIRPLVIKDKCELCGCEENLVVHHDKEFSILLDETLKELNLYKLEFNEDEFNIIKTHMLGKQIQIKNITLCNKCHTELHKNKGGFSSTGKYIDINKIKEMKRKKEKEIELKEKEQKLKEYLETIIDKRLHKEDREELINMIDLRDSRNRVQKSISAINSYLIENCNYTINSKKVKEQGKLVTIWLVSKIDCPQKCTNKKISVINER